MLIAVERLRVFKLPWYFWVPSLIVVAGVVVPLAYLLLRAFEAETAQLSDLVFRMRNLRLLGNTVGLLMGVLAVSIVLAFPLAWLTTRTDLPAKRGFTLLGVLPLTIPSYVMAYVLLATTGGYGTLTQLFGIPTDRMSGYTGALLALSFYTFPYLFLNLRSALMGLDPALEESARALGYRPYEVFWRVIVPQLRPAFYAGGLIIGLHVLGDFGVVSLMRFETFSYAIYLQYSAAFDRVYAAWLALMLLALTASVLYTEARLLRGVRLHRTGTGTRRIPTPQPLGVWRVPAALYIGVLGLITFALPLLTLLFWAGHSDGTFGDLTSALWGSISASAPAAFGAAVLALPIAYLSIRRPSAGTKLLERTAYFGYATPPLAFALAFIMFTLNTLPFIYQTLFLLITAYALHYLAEGLGPIRSALYQAPPRLEEAARSLGYGPLAAFFKATFPLLRRGLVVSIAFVFLACMKELPMTFLLSPPGFESLALKVWTYANEAMFAEVAPYALTLMLFSSAFVGLLLLQEDTPTRNPQRRS